MGNEMKPRESIENTVGMMMTGLNDVVHVDMDLDEAASRMETLDVPLLPVVDGEEIVGVLTDKDIRAYQTEADGPGRGKVSNILSTDIVFCYESDTLETANSVMETSGHPILLVVNDQEKLTGIVSRDAIAGAAGNEPEQSPAEDLDARSAQGPGRDQDGTNGSPRSYSIRPVIRNKR
jgi:predicted transcriptional regulator